MKKKTRASLAIVPPPGSAAPCSHRLRPSTQAWVDHVRREYALEGHHENLLLLAATALDRAAAAREVLDRDGVTYVDRFRQPKPRPEVGVEKDACNTFRLLVRELGLDLPHPGDGRPPRIGG